MAETPLVALRGDTWLSPSWSVAVGGQRVEVRRPDDPPAEGAWIVRAQVRRTLTDAEALLDWSALPGGSGPPGVLLGTRTDTLSTGAELELVTVQLQIRPSDWPALPSTYSGLIEVEISSDDSSFPAARWTLTRRKFKIEQDLVR